MAPGHVIEYGGEAVLALTMEERMTLSNMSIEAGARAGMIAPDEKTFAYLKGRQFASADHEAAVEAMASMAHCSRREYDRKLTTRRRTMQPQVTWGTSPGQVAPVTGAVPNPADAPAENDRKSRSRRLEYMGFAPRMCPPDFDRG